MSIQKEIGRQVTTNNGHIQNHSQTPNLDWWISVMSERFMPNYPLREGYVREFVETWLQNLESKGSPAWVASHLQDLMDLDLATDEMVNKFISQMVPQIDLSKVTINVRFLLKNIRQVLAKRGSFEGLCFLFALLGDDVEIVTPSDWMLGCSNESFISADFKITDGVYYTPFTYDIKSHIDPDIWKSFIRSICHPHGSVMHTTHIYDSFAPDLPDPDEQTTSDIINFSVMRHRQFGSPLGPSTAGLDFLREVVVEIDPVYTSTFIYETDTVTPIEDWDAIMLGHIQQEDDGSGRGRGIVREVRGGHLYIEVYQEFKPPVSLGIVEEIVSSNQVRVTDATDINVGEKISIRGLSFNVDSKATDVLTLSNTLQPSLPLKDSFVGEGVSRSLLVSFGNGTTGGVSAIYPTRIYYRSPWTQQILDGLSEVILGDLEDPSTLGDEPMQGITSEIIYGGA